jgi:hypothetical protein
LTPAAGGTGQHQSGASKKEDQQSKIRLTGVSTVRGDCQLDRRCLCARSWLAELDADGQRLTVAMVLVHTKTVIF